MGDNADFAKANFNNDVNFNGMKVNGTIRLNDTNFNYHADFSNIRIEKIVESLRTNYKGNVNFNSAVINGSALFNYANFQGEFFLTAARVGGSLELINTMFKEKVNFYLLHVDGDLRLDGSIFEKDLILRSASVKTIYFINPESKFEGNIDLIGCIYDDIIPTTIWRKLLTKLMPYDRQPFSHLEELNRKAGE